MLAAIIYIIEDDVFYIVPALDTDFRVQCIESIDNFNNSYLYTYRLKECRH